MKCLVGLVTRHNDPGFKLNICNVCSLVVVAIIVLKAYVLREEQHGGRKHVTIPTEWRENIGNADLVFKML